MDPRSYETKSALAQAILVSRVDEGLVSAIVRLRPERCLDEMADVMSCARAGTSGHLRVTDERYREYEWSATTDGHATHSSLERHRAWDAELDTPAAEQACKDGAPK